MLKLKQKIVLFIEPDSGWTTPSKIGKSFMNRFSIDEDASFEILQIIEVHIEDRYDAGQDRSNL